MAIDPNQLEELTEETHLRYISDTKVKGISRLSSGKNFKYLEPDGKLVKDLKTLERIKSLVIPPNWQKVWISPGSNTHLQATGTDEKGRKQYLYHPKWIAYQSENKFSKMPDFGLTLPKIRRRIREDMGLSALSREKVLATVVWLLEHTFIRVGNDEYARENKSFGLTTMREKHIDLLGDTVKFEFIGKSGVKHSLSIHHPKVSRTIRQLLELPGYEIFHYPDGDGEIKVVDSSDVNDYLKRAANQDITAKDYRTWGGTFLSAVYLNDLGNFESKTQADKNISEVVKKVAKNLGNKPSTCKNYYVHPVVIESYQNKTLIPHFQKMTSSDQKPEGLTKEEYALITLIESFS